MTLKQKMLRGLIAGAVGLAAAVAAVGGGGLPGSAATCQRTIAIDPQVTASETSRNLTFVVHTNSCAAAGSVFFDVVNTGSAQRPDDFMLEDGVLTWQTGDLSNRKITVTINNDLLREPLFEDFNVMLLSPSTGLRVTGGGKGQGRIFDDDQPGRFTATDDQICLISGDNSCLPTRPGSTTPAPVPQFGPIGKQTIEPGHLIVAPIVLNTTSTANATIHFATFNGGLVANVDYVPVDRDVNVPAGAIVVFVNIELLPHAYTQPGQSFGTLVSNYTAGMIADPTGVVTMLL